MSSNGNPEMSHDELEARIAAWAESHPDVRAILVVGSRARRDSPADEWSDLDLMVFATHYEEYLANDSWLDDIGPTWLCLRLRQAGVIGNGSFASLVSLRLISSSQANAHMKLSQNWHLSAHLPKLRNRC